MPGIAESLREVGGAQVTRCSGDMPDMDMLRRVGFDLLVLDLRNARGEIPPVVDTFRRSCPGAPIVVAAGDSSTNLAMEALRRGTCDFVVRPQDDHQLQALVRHVVGTDGSAAPTGHLATPGAGQGARPTLYEMERNFILRTLEECKWNKKRTASLLGINRSSLYSKIRRFGIGNESMN